MLSFAGKRVLFVTTKNLDYIRNMQEIELIRQQSEKLEIIGSNSRHYPKRIIKVYFQLLFKSIKEIDTVFIAHASQLVLPFWNWKFKNKNIIIDFFISLYDTLVFDRKKFSQNSLCGRFMKRLDRRTIQKADMVIADTKNHGEYFIEEFGLKRDKLEVLYLKADKSIYYPRSIERPDRMSGKYVVLYFGSVLPLQGVSVILDAIELLLENKELYFIMIGPINDKYKKPMAKNIEYHDWLSQKTLADHIAYSDLCLAGHFNDRINKAKRTIPGKAYIYQAMNKPMILGDNPANRELYPEESDNIYYVEMGNAKALADKILEIKESKW